MTHYARVSAAAWVHGPRARLGRSLPSERTVETALNSKLDLDGHYRYRKVPIRSASPIIRLILP